MSGTSTPSPAPAATIVVLAYNSADTLRACLKAIAPQATTIGAEVVVVDNASRDDSASVAREEGARVVTSSTNLGFAGGCNLGVRSTTGEVVVLVNPDTVFDPGALSKLVGVARNHGGPVGGRAHHGDGRFDARCAMGRPRLRGAVTFALGLSTLARASSWFDPEAGPTDIPAGDGVMRVEAVSGAVLACTRDRWESLGGLDEDFFVYGEDVDMCVRAAGTGPGPVVAAGAGYEHVGGMASDATLHRRILLHRGKVELYRRHLAPPWGRVATTCLQAGCLLRGLPAVLPDNPATERARPWLDLFRARATWSAGHTGARDAVEVTS